jgi:Ribbon-helix-helix protein, copG family
MAAMPGLRDNGRCADPSPFSEHRDIIRYHKEEVRMTDVLIRDVPDDVIAALDSHASRLGLSRSEYVRRRLAQDAAASGGPVSTRDLERFAGAFGDLANPEVMSRAWQ